MEFGREGRKTSIRSKILPHSEGRMGSVIKKRRKKIRKHKYKKLRKRMRHQRK